MTRPVVLDVTRSVARAGRPVPSGIDRVERAYLGWAVARGAWLLCRIGQRQHVVAPERAGRLAAFLNAPPARVGRILSAALPRRTRAEALVRWLAGGANGEALARLAPRGTPCLFVGHENLSSAGALSEAGLAPVAMIHDTIPLDFPGFSGPGAPERFAAALRDALGTRHLLCNSHATLADVARHATAWGVAVPSATVLPLGIDAGEAMAPAAGAPRFVMLGTIEGRKNHLAMLRLWERLAAGGVAPGLDIVGPRGWAAEETFRALDRLRGGAVGGGAVGGGAVVEHGALGDAAARALVGRARALLFPSLAEGYGLPVAEALATGVPVIASDLPALREVGGAVPEWLDPADAAGWEAAVRDYAADPSPRREAQLERLRDWRAPRWDTHFAGLEALLDGLAAG